MDTLDPGIEVNINIFYGWSQLINAYSTVLTLGHWEFYNEVIPTLAIWGLIVACVNARENDFSLKRNEVYNH